MEARNEFRSSLTQLREVGFTLVIPLCRFWCTDRKEEFLDCLASAEFCLLSLWGLQPFLTFTSSSLTTSQNYQLSGPQIHRGQPSHVQQNARAPFNSPPRGRSSLPVNVTWSAVGPRPDLSMMGLQNQRQCHVRSMNEDLQSGV